MTKDQILNYAAPNPSQQSEGIALAYQHATEEVVRARVAEAEIAAARADLMSGRWSRVHLLPILLVAGGGLGLFLGQGTMMLWCLGAALGSFVLVNHQVEKYEHSIRCQQSVLNALQPIAGTATCEKALQYLEADAPGVVAWRDIALSERGQLYRFDVDIMRRLHELAEHHRYWDAKPKDDAERRREIDEACRKVHGLSPMR